MNAPAQNLNKREIRQMVLVSIVINGIAPLVAYAILSPRMSDIAALSIAALIPALDNVYTLIKHRHLDVFAAFMLAGFILSIGLVLLGGDKRVILIKESMLTGVLGTAMLASLLLPRPILFYFAGHFTAGSDPVARAEFAAKWVSPYFRFVMYLMTIVWGLALLGEALVRTALVFAIPSTEEFLAISPVVQYGFLGAAILWTIWYARRARERAARLTQQRAVQVVTA